jgi:hypothetical protein
MVRRVDPVELTLSFQLEKERVLHLFYFQAVACNIRYEISAVVQHFIRLAKVPLKISLHEVRGNRTIEVAPDVRLDCGFSESISEGELLYNHYSEVVHAGRTGVGPYFLGYLQAIGGDRLACTGGASVSL